MRKGGESWRDREKGGISATSGMTEDWRKKEQEVGVVGGVKDKETEILKFSRD